MKNGLRAIAGTDAGLKTMCWTAWYHDTITERGEKMKALAAKREKEQKEKAKEQKLLAAQLMFGSMDRQLMAAAVLDWVQVLKTKSAGARSHAYALRMIANNAEV